MPEEAAGDVSAKRTPPLTFEIPASPFMRDKGELISRVLGRPIPGWSASPTILPSELLVRKQPKAGAYAGWTFHPSPQFLTAFFFSVPLVEASHTEC